jgi:hypothetical protein
VALNTQQLATLGGAGVGFFFGGPSGAMIGSQVGSSAGSLFGGRSQRTPNAERFASGLTALACLRSPSSAACQGPRNLFTSDYWRRRYPDSARKWQAFYSTGRPQWTEQWITQAIGYQAQRYGIPVGVGVQLGQQRLGTGYGNTYSSSPRVLRFA